MTEEPAPRAPHAPRAPQSPTTVPEVGPAAARPPADDTAPRNDEQIVIVCLTRCYPCQFDEHPKGPHTWMAEDDAEHAGHPWPLPNEIAAKNPCGCPCEKETPGA